MTRNHENTDFVYNNPRPELMITSKGGSSLGRCYSASYFEVVSLKPLSKADLDKLRECGFLGYGQEFYAYQLVGDKKVGVPQTLDWRSTKNVEPSGRDVVPCTMVDRGTRQFIPGEAINPYSKRPYEPMEFSYYIYQCESRVDSSD